MDDKVKNYIEKQDEPKKVILETLRELLLSTIEGCHEEFNWGAPIYDGGKFYIAAMRERVHIGFAIMGLSEDEIKVFEGTGKAMRHLKIYTVEDIEKKDVKNLISLVHKKASVPPDYKSL